MTIRQTPEDESDTKREDEIQRLAIRDPFLNLLMVCFSRLIVIQYHMLTSTPAAFSACLFQTQAAGSAASAAFGSVLIFHKNCYSNSKSN